MYKILFALAFFSTSLMATEEICLLDYQITHFADDTIIKQENVQWRRNGREHMLSFSDSSKPTLIAEIENDNMVGLRLWYRPLNKGVELVNGDIKLLMLPGFSHMVRLHMAVPHIHAESKQIEWQNHTVNETKWSQGDHIKQVRWHSQWDMPISVFEQRGALSKHIEIKNMQTSGCTWDTQLVRQVDWMDYADIGDDETNPFAQTFIRWGFQGGHNH
ncbi:hypothetical protein [Marinicella sp. W31]|uniref:hypothetical protein n=1 Tax=Marinicella sp. W31 TaxID=3023713 RepID=UPI003756A91A